MQNPLVLAFLMALVLFGCVSQNTNYSAIVQNQNKDYADIVQNPEKFYNQEVTVTAIQFRQSPTDTVPRFELSSSPVRYGDDYYRDEFKFYYSIIDHNEEGKPIFLSINYTHFYCNNCQITGVIKFVSSDLCDCEYLSLGGASTGYSRLLSPSACTGNDQRCAADSEGIQTRYFLDVTKVKQLDRP